MKRPPIQPIALPGSPTYDWRKALDLGLIWSNYDNSGSHLIVQGLNSATSRNKAGSTSQWDPQHMAGQSAAKAHSNTHDAPAAPQGPAAPGVAGFGARLRVVAVGCGAGETGRF